MTEKDYGIDLNKFHMTLVPDIFNVKIMEYEIFDDGKLKCLKNKLKADGRDPRSVYSSICPSICLSMYTYLYMEI